MRSLLQERAASALGGTMQSMSPLQIFAELKFQEGKPQRFHLLFEITENIETEGLYWGVCVCVRCVRQKNTTGC